MMDRLTGVFGESHRFHWGMYQLCCGFSGGVHILRPQSLRIGVKEVLVEKSVARVMNRPRKRLL
jgi:hypothetical protein